MSDDLPQAPPRVTVRYWAAARAAAGLAQEQVAASTLADVIVTLKGRHADPAYDRVIDHCAILLGETPIGTRDHGDVRLTEGDTVEFLPPFAGG